MKVLHTEASCYPADARSRLSRFADVDYIEVASQASLLTSVAAAEYEAVFVRLGMHVDRAFLDAAPHVKVIVTPTTGRDHLDLDALRARNVVLISLFGETELLEDIHATAEHTWALLLALLRQIPRAHRDVLEGRWRREPFIGEELFGRTLGVLGYGRLGRKVAGFGCAFGMRVLAHDTDPASFSIASHDVQAVSLAELFAGADILSVHLPLNPSTCAFIGKSQLAQMRPGSVLINTARGELIDEAALLASLESGHLSGAALDVLVDDAKWPATGTPAEGHALVAYARNHAQLVLTPHCGGYARRSIHATRRHVTDRFIEHIQQKVRI